MNRGFDQPTKTFGLVANGSSGRWDVEVDEAPGGGEWVLEIDGPQAYLVFQLQNLSVIPEALRFLRSGLSQDSTENRPGGKTEGTLALGRFGPAAVSLAWDNEDRSEERRVGKAGSM